MGGGGGVERNLLINIGCYRACLKGTIVPGGIFLWSVCYFSLLSYAADGVAMEDKKLQVSKLLAKVAGVKNCGCQSCW